MIVKPSPKQKPELNINPATTYQYKDPNYQHPTVQDVNKMYDYTRSVKVSGTKKLNIGPNNWKDWTIHTNDSEYSSIPYTIWRLLLLQYEIVRF